MEKPFDVKDSDRLKYQLNELKKMVRKYYGQPCHYKGSRDFNDGCVCCRMWLAYDIINNNVADIIDEMKREERKKNGKRRY